MSLKNGGIAIALLAMAQLAGCGREWEYREIGGEVWTTGYHIRWQKSAAAPDAERLRDSIQSVFSEVESSLSVFNDNSTVSRVNRGEQTEADTLFRRVLELSREVSGLSGGRFDPTVGPLIELYGFGRNRKAKEVSQEDVDSLMRYVGIQSTGIDADGRIRKPHPRTQFNFSSIAKGMAADLISEMLRRNGVENHMIEIGGDIRAGGVNEAGSPWRILIESPRDVNKEWEPIMLHITSGGVATSGNYRKYHAEAGGKRIGHIIDATTGRPAETDILSATVVATDCATADALATACMTMKSEMALRMVEEVAEAQAILVVKDKKGKIEIVKTSNKPHNENTADTEGPHS